MGCDGGGEDPLNAELSNLLKAIERIAEQMKTADTELCTYLLDELYSLKQLNTKNFQAWLKIDEKIEDLIDLFQVQINMHLHAIKPSSDIRMYQMRTGIAPSMAKRKSLESPALDIDIENIAFEALHPAEITLRKGMAYYELHMFSSASRSLEQALSQMDTPTTRLYLAASYAAILQHEKALNQVQIIRQCCKKPEIIAASMEIEAHIHVVNGQLENAIRCYLDIANLTPNYTDVWFNLGVCYLTNGELLAAERAFLHVLKKQPTDAQCIQLLALTQYQRQDIQNARKTCLQGLNQFPRQLELLAIASAICTLDGDFKNGISLSQQMILSNPHHPLGYVHLARHYIHAGLPNSAVLTLKRILSLRPKENTLLMYYGITLFLTKELSQAESVLFSSLMTGKEKALIWITLGQISVYRKQYDKAAARFKRAFLDPRVSIKRLALYYYGQCLRQQGQFRKAERYLRAAEKIEHHENTKQEDSFLIE